MTLGEPGTGAQADQQLGWVRSEKSRDVTAMDTGPGRRGPGQTEAPAHAAMPGACCFPPAASRALAPAPRPANGGATDAAQVPSQRAQRLK